MTKKDLSDVALAQFTWKSQIMRSAIVQVCRRAAECSELFWPDEVDLSPVPKEHRNCIGSVFRTLAKLGVISHTGSFRKSKGELSNGRVVFAYMANRKLANAILARMGQPTNQPNYIQQDLITN